MAYEDRLGPDEMDDLASVVRQRGMDHLMGIMDEVLERMKGELISIPLPADPEKASLALYAKRMEAAGAQALKIAFQSRIQRIKYNQEG